MKSTTNFDNALAMVKGAIAGGDLVYFKIQYYNRGSFPFTAWLNPFYAFNFLCMHQDDFYRIIKKSV